MHKKLVKKLFLTGTFVWTVLIVFLTIAPSESLPAVKIGLNDKVLHFMFFYIYGFLVYGGIFTDKHATWKVLMVLVIVNLFGFGLEILQKSIPGRSYDGFDILFNFIGTLLGVTNYLVVSSKIFR